MKLARALPVLMSSLALLASAPPAAACTTFFADTPDGPVVGKSFDWQTDRGYLVANERGRVRVKLVPGGAPEVARWSATYASLSFSTVGPGFPSSGMNEAGLVVEALVDNEVRASSTPDAARLTGLELVQYALDRFETVDAFGAFAERVGVSQLAVPLHFFACDATRACVVIESKEGDSGVRVTREKELRAHVLANRPWRVDAASAAAASPIPAGVGVGIASSSKRFGAVTRGLATAPLRSPSDALTLLGSVESSATAWQIVWNVATKSAQWREPRRGPAVSSVALDAKVACQGAPRVRRVGAVHGDAFVAWTDADSVAAARAVGEQVGGDGATVRVLGRAVAAATLATRCQASP